MKILPVSTILGIATVSASATVFINETFTYANGNLTDADAWAAHSGAGSSPVQVISGAAVLFHGSGTREDVSVSFAAQTAGTLTAEFDLMVSDDAPIDGSTLEYFAHFMSGELLCRTLGRRSGRLRWRLFAWSGIDHEHGGDHLGFRPSFDTTYKVGLSFEFASGLASLSVDGAPSIATVATSLSDTLDGFGLRQSNTSSDETITIDNLRIYDNAIGRSRNPQRSGCSAD